MFLVCVTMRSPDRDSRNHFKEQDKEQGLLYEWQHAGS